MRFEAGARFVCPTIFTSPSKLCYYLVGLICQTPKMPVEGSKTEYTRTDEGKGKKERKQKLRILLGDFLGKVNLKPK